MEGSQWTNQVILRGTAAGEALFSHESHGQRFYRFPLAVCRLSQRRDQLWVLATREQLSPLSPLPGRPIAVEGELRSFNNRSGQGSRLVISVLARQLSPRETDDREDCNLVRLSGVLCKPPVVRRTPLGRCICDVMLAVNRRYGRADYLPCIAWGQVAAQVGALSVGDRITLEGRFQSREYNKVTEGCTQVRTAFEVSIMQLLAPHSGEIF